MNTDRLSPLEHQIIGAIAAHGEETPMPLADLWARVAHVNIQQFELALGKLELIQFVATSAKHAVLLAAGADFLNAAVATTGHTLGSLHDLVERTAQQCIKDRGFLTVEDESLPIFPIGAVPTKAVDHEGGAGVVANRKPPTNNAKGGAEQSSSAPTVSPLWRIACTKAASAIDWLTENRNKELRGLTE